MKPSDISNSKANWADVMPLFRQPAVYDEDCPPLDFTSLPPPVSHFKGRLIPPRTAASDPIDPEVIEFMKSLSPLIQMEDNILDGMPVFKNTRVPVQHMFDYLLAGKTVDDFVQRFPEVPKPVATCVLNTESTLFYEEISKLLLLRKTNNPMRK